MPGRVGKFGQVAWFGRVERPGQARADLRGDAGPVVFEKDPGSIACPGFIPRHHVCCKIFFRNNSHVAKNKDGKAQIFFATLFVLQIFPATTPMLQKIVKKNLQHHLCCKLFLQHSICGKVFLQHNHCCDDENNVWIAIHLTVAKAADLLKRSVG